MTDKEKCRRIVREVFEDIDKEAMEMFGEDMEMVKDFDDLVKVSDVLDQINPQGVN